MSMITCGYGWISADTRVFGHGWPIDFIVHFVDWGWPHLFIDLHGIHGTFLFVALLGSVSFPTIFAG